MSERSRRTHRFYLSGKRSSREEAALETALAADAPAHGVALGEPAPWFSARSVSGATVDLHVDAGRWVVLAFLGAPDAPGAADALAALLGLSIFDEDRIVLYAIVSAPPQDGVFAAAGAAGPAVSLIADYDGALARLYGAGEGRRVIVLDPMLRTVANLAWDWAAVARLLSGLPEVDQSAGVPMTAPVLMVARVFDFELCDLLVALYDTVGGTESGFLLDRDGKTATVVDHRLKRRQDMIIALPDLRERIRARLLRRLVPAIERYFQFRPTRIDRFLVACYDAAQGGYFFRHRDNVNAGAQHRRFAVTINLNGDYEGGDLVLPEFGRRRYRAPVGGAIVFSCGALHEVTPMTRGRRYAFLPFLYGEEDAVLRRMNNARLAEGETPYAGEDDRLFPV